MPAHPREIMQYLLKARSPSCHRLFLTGLFFLLLLMFTMYLPVSAETGDAGETVIPYQQMPGGHYGQVAFVLDVPEEITEPCIIQFTESESYQEYYAEALKSNNYTVTLKLPQGTYLISSAGPEDDYAEIYSTVEQNQSFTVERGAQSTVDLTIRSQTEIYHNTVKDVKKALENKGAETPKVEATEQKKGNGLMKVGICLLLIGTAIAIIFWVIAKKHGDQSF